VGAYDPQHQQLSYVVAGHEAPLVLQGDQLQSLTVGGPALGLFPGATFQPGQCQLQAGGLLLAFSDGLPDARTPTGESFGQTRIAALLQTRPSTSWTAAELVQQFRQTVQEHMGTAEQFDDLTLLSLKVGG
jgi:serine phosphatase RsbU (regulator of sigma subunit)